ncbi:hypothetical protein SPD48_11245 [Pseudogracilibacillus sp. SE30717A]|uniref:hypothetical protein n=1 Tax=Pseudogracilibacillus sp. SE30717A TaxID=3098293 RepID=UPI00300E2B61
MFKKEFGEDLAEVDILPLQFHLIYPIYRERTLLQNKIEVILLYIQNIQTKMPTNSDYQKTQTDNLIKMKINKGSLKKNESIPLRTESVTISQKGWDIYNDSLKFKQVNEDDKLGDLFQKFYEEYNSIEAIERRQLEELEKENSYNRFEDDFNLEGIESLYPENTLHHTIKKALEGKVKNASVYAAELASAIRSSVSMPEKSAEEQAAYREMALKQAEYIAENYFEDEQEAKNFMDEINRYYENDILRAKGYVVIDNSDIEPFKRYSSPLSNNDDVSFYALTKKYMDKEYFERFINGEGTHKETSEFLLQLQANKEKYTKAILEESVLNEKQTETNIELAKSILESLEWENGRAAKINEEQPSYLDALLKWNNNMLNLFT